jgi:hypothetical protein
MPRSKTDVESALEKKGFERTEGDHHYFVYVRKDGKKTLAKTKTSHTRKMKDIPDSLLAQMARQVCLTKPEFLRLVDCPMSRDEYEQKLCPQVPTTPDQQEPHTNDKKSEKGKR